MTPATIFEIGNALALFSWILLIAFYHKSWSVTVVFSFSVVLLAVTYAYIMLPNLSKMEADSFSTLANVKALFTSDEAVTAGWMHYLAFDLMVGLYIVSNAKSYHINRYLLIIPLLLTFMLGPVGLLTYLILRTGTVKKWVAY